MTGTQTVLAVAGAAGLARAGWDTGGVFTGLCGRVWRRWLVPMRCQRCRQIVFGAARGPAHLSHVHGAEIEAEQVLSAEAARQFYGRITGQLDDDL